MIQKQFAEWMIEHDKAATEAAYSTLPFDIGCTCHTCRNYIACIPNLPDEARDFFAQLGMDPAKPSEVYENTFEEGAVLYGGFYHLVGNYLSGDDVWQPVTENHEQQKYTAFYKITDGFEIGFTKHVSLVPDGFPQPALQMEIIFTLPWVLEEAYDAEIKEDAKSGNGTYLVEGMCIGLGIGVALGQFAFGELAIGVSIGMCLGLAVGVSIKKKRHKKNRRK